jgi:hypothetical protein
MLFDRGKICCTIPWTVEGMDMGRKRNRGKSFRDKIFGGTWCLRATEQQRTGGFATMGAGL